LFLFINTCFKGVGVIKIFAIPYAFGSSCCYYDLKKCLNSSIELISLDYSGHGKRISDPLLYEVGDIADDLYRQIKSELQRDEKYALLGYSMGGLMCYEILKRIKDGHYPKNVFIFSSHYPGHIYESDEYEHYELEDVKALLKEYGGTPEYILEYNDFLTFMKPIVCADMIALRDYSNNDTEYRINCPLTVICGSDETDTPESFEKWKTYSLNSYYFYIFQGGHFFLFENTENLRKGAEIINQKSLML